MLVSVTAASRARAQADDPMDPRPAPALWSATGRPGWTPGSELGVPGAWTLLGLPLGAWRVQSEPGGPATTGPGVREADGPRAWFDSVDVRLGGDGARSGWDAALATATVSMVRPVAGRARAVVTVTNGSSSVDRNGLLFARGDSRGWIRLGSTGDSHDGLGAIGRSGAHVWFAEAARVRGDHTLNVNLRQRGAATRQVVGVGEGMRGQDGALRWAWTHGERWAKGEIGRAWDARDSRAEDEGVLLTPSRRDAQRTGAAFEAGRRWRGADVSTAWRVDRERVRRPVDATTARSFDAKAERWWGSVAMERALAGGTLDARLGGGWHSALRSRGDEVQVAPTLSWRRSGERGGLRVYGERVLTPVWADLATDVTPYLQSTWTAGGEATRRWPGVASLRVGLAGGVTDGAATLLRYPVMDVALRGGVAAPDGESRPFVLSTLAAAARWRAFVAEVEAYGMDVRGAAERETRFDPETGAAARLESEFRLFAGDLGVRVVGQVAHVGAREALVFDDFGQNVNQRLGSYVTFDALVALTLGEAVLRLRGVNLADERREEPWLDPGTGRAALGSGRQVLFEIGWVFAN